jgi:two-component system sensor histidine kinase BaeS
MEPAIQQNHRFQRQGGFSFMSPNRDFDEWRQVQCKLNKLFVHDLKNPISALSANLSFLDTALIGETEEVRGAVSDSLLAAEMLLRFAENLNAIAMLEADEHGTISQVSLEKFVRVTVARNEKFAKSAGVRLQMEGTPEDVLLTGQHRYAELALENLILTSIRHSPQGGEVTVSSAVENGQAIISVCDHGRPVSKEDAEKLFTRTTQAEAKKHPGSRYGRGIGLYAVGLAVKALGGAVEVGTRDGMTEFALILPLPADE